MLVYLNDVAEGGETAFLMQVRVAHASSESSWAEMIISFTIQGQLVAPRCGRVTIFPTAFTHVHAGRPPLSGPKYAISQFIRI